MADSMNASYINEKGILHYKAGEFIEAISCWEEAASLGNSSAMFGLGVIYLDGNCVEKDVVKARTWFENATKAGHKNADKQLKKLNSVEIEPNEEVKKIPIRQFTKLRFGCYEWIVLSRQDGKNLCISKDVIDIRRYNETNENVTWETCDLRKWLNSEFMDEFTLSEKKQILESENFNVENSVFKTVGGNATIDRMFLLSVDEVIEYFGDNGSLENAKNVDLLMTDQYDEVRRAVLNMSQKQLKEAENRYKHDYNKINGQFIGWWLRTPGNGNDKAVRINCNGAIRVHGRAVNCNLNGIRPAFWMNTDKNAESL